MLIWNLAEQFVLGTLSLVAVRGVLVGDVLSLILLSPGSVQWVVGLANVFSVRPSLFLEALASTLLVISALSLGLSLVFRLVGLVLGLLVGVLSNVGSLACGTGVTLVVGDSEVAG